MKSKSQGGDSGKSSVARLRKEVEEMEKKLSCSEKEKKALEARNQYLEAENRTLKARLVDALLQLPAWLPSLRVASAVPEMPRNGVQAVSALLCLAMVVYYNDTSGFERTRLGRTHERPCRSRPESQYRYYRGEPASCTL